MTHSPLTARITLDNLRIFLRPVFKTNYRQLPKSVRDFVKSKTDCPIYRILAKVYVLEYLCDLRDYVVHYRSFATSENLVIIGDHVDPEQVKALLEENKWFEPTARAYFRRIDSRVRVDVDGVDATGAHRPGSRQSVSDVRRPLARRAW